MHSTQCQKSTQIFIAHSAKPQTLSSLYARDGACPTLSNANIYDQATKDMINNIKKKDNETSGS